VPGLSGRTICDAHPARDYMKIDVEGFEHSVPAGFGPHLKQVSVLLIEANDLAAERTGVGPEVLSNFLEQQEFKGPYRVDFDGRTLSAGESGVEDSVWIAERFVPRLRSELGSSFGPPMR
jgi:hypothetical protein